MDPPSQHCQSTEWSLHCSMLPLRLKDRWIPQNTVRAQIDLFTVQCCHSDSKAEGPPWSTLSEHRVISSLFNVVIQTQRQMDSPVNMVRAQSYLFTVQCCHSDSKADGPPWSTLSEHRVISSLFNVVIETQRQIAPPWSTLSEQKVISLQFNVVIETQRQKEPPVNIVRAQSDIFIVQCCHSDSKADGLPSQHGQSTEWSLHCSMLSLRLKGRWTPPVNIVRAQSDLFTVQCCHSDSKADGPPMCKTLPEHRVISSLFNVVIQTQRQMATRVNTVRAQSYLLTVQCCHSDSKAEVTPPVNTVRAQSYLFTVQCCHSDSKADGPHQSTLSEHRVISSLFNVVIETQRQTDTPQSTLSEHSVISSLFNVVIQTQRQMNPLCAKHCQSTEWSLHCSMLSFRLTQADGTAYVQNTVRAQSDLFTVQCCHSDSKADETHGQHCQSTEWSLHCSMLSFRLTHIWTSYMQNTVRAQSDLFTVQCCHSDSKTDGPPWSTLSGHRVISSLFNVVIQTQRQMDPPVNIVRAQCDLFTVQCCHSDSKADGPPMCKPLPEHRVISSLFNVVIQTQRQMEPMVNIVRAQSDLFTVQCCHSDSKADGHTSQHCQSTEWSLHCSMLSFRLKGRWTPQSTLSEHRVISSLFNVVIQTQRQMDPTVNTVRAQSDLFTVQCCHSDSKADGPPYVQNTAEHRVISSLFNVVIQTQRQMDPPSQHCQSTEWSLHCSMLSFRLKGRWTPPVNTVRAQSDLFTVQCCLEHIVRCTLQNTVRVISSLFNVVIQTQRQMDPPVNTVRAQSWSLHCSMLSLRLKGRWTPQSTLSEHRVISDQCCLLTVQCCHSDSKADGPPESTLSEHRVISSLFNVVIETQRQTDTPQPTLSEHSVISSLFNVVIQTQMQMNPLQNTVRAQSDLFTVQCCHSDSHTYELPMCKTLPEHRVISSLFNVVIETQRQMDPPVNTVRAQCNLFTVQCCHWDSKADWHPPVNTVRTQSDLFTVQCCHSDSKADESHGQHCQSTEWSLHCSMLSFRLKGR